MCLARIGFPNVEWKKKILHYNIILIRVVFDKIVKYSKKY
jgi:hypothetical protein